MVISSLCDMLGGASLSLPAGNLLASIRSAVAFASYFVLFPAAMVGDSCLALAVQLGAQQPWRLSFACAFITFGCTCSSLLRIWWVTVWPLFPRVSFIITVDASMLSLVWAACEAVYILALATLGVLCLCSWFILSALLKHPFFFSTWFALAFRSWLRR